MAQKQQKPMDPISEPKKKRRVALSPIDSGVEANDCIQIYLVSSKEEAEAGSGCLIDPIDLNQSIGDDDGKIYGYQGLKIVILFSSISFRAYVDVKYESTCDRGKGVTDLNAALKDILAENVVEKKEDFLQSFSTESNYISSVVSKGEILKENVCNGKSDTDNTTSHADSANTEVVRLVMGDMSFGYLYSRLVPLVLLLVDGSNPIDVTDSNWEMYVVVQKITNMQGDQHTRLLGFAASYRFYHYPDSLRLRLSQILVLPPYQNKGYGHRLLEILNNIAISENVYDLTVEEPVDSLQHIRYCIDIPRLLFLSSVQDSMKAAASHLKETNLSKQTNTPQLLPPQTVVEDVRKSLKINKKQFTQCWDILIYLALDPTAKKWLENYRILITDRVKTSVIGRDSGTLGKKVVETPNEFGDDAFVMYKCQDEEGNVEVDEEQKKTLEQQLQELVDDRIKEIKSVAEKVSANRA